MSTTHLEDLTDRIRPRQASNLLLWAILGFVAIAIGWAALTELDRTVRGVGRVIPSSQLQTVSNLEGGIVAAILVRTGATVKAGAPLVRLDRTQSGSEYGSSQATYDALTMRIARLSAEVAGREPRYPPAPGAAGAELADIERSLHVARMAELQSLLAGTQARVAQAQRAVAEAASTYQARISARDAAKRELEMIRPLVERGIEPRLTLVQTESSAAVAASEAASAQAGVARARAGVLEASAALVQARQDWRARAAGELAAAQGEHAARRSAMPALADRLTRTVVRAPLPGRINRVLVTTVGATVRAGEPIAEIVPSDDSLLIEAQVAPKDIASVRLDQRARVEITAYDSSVYGFLEGKVVAISPDALNDERTGQTHYLVRVRTDRDALLGASRRRLPIGPGMLAAVSLLGDKRSVLNYLLSPLTRISQTALRE